MGSSELRIVLEAALGWAERRIRSGETNIKGYYFISACVALADAIELGLPQKEIEQAVISTGSRVSEKSWELLKEVAEREGVHTGQNGEPLEDLNLRVDMDDILEMPFDWIDDLTWDNMGGFPWTRQVSQPMGEMGSIDPSVVSHFDG